MTSDASTNREDATLVAQPGTSPSKDRVRDRIALFESMREELRLPHGQSRRLSASKPPIDLSKDKDVRMRKMSVVEGPKTKEEYVELPPLSIVWPDEVIVATAGSPFVRYGMMFVQRKPSDVRRKEEEEEEEKAKKAEKEVEGTDQTLQDWKCLRELTSSKESKDDEAFAAALKSFVEEIIQNAMSECDKADRKSSFELRFDETFKELQAMDEALDAVEDSEEKEVLEAPVVTGSEASPSDLSKNAVDSEGLEDDGDVFLIAVPTHTSDMPKITVSSESDVQPPAYRSDANEIPYDVVPTARRAVMDDDDNPYNVPSVGDDPHCGRSQSLGGYSADDSTSVSGQSDEEEECPYDRPPLPVFEEVPYDILPNLGPRNRTDTDVTLRKSPMPSGDDKKLLNHHGKEDSPAGDNDEPQGASREPHANEGFELPEKEDLNDSIRPIPHPTRPFDPRHGFFPSDPAPDLPPRRQVGSDYSQRSSGQSSTSYLRVSQQSSSGKLSDPDSEPLQASSDSGAYGQNTRKHSDNPENRRRVQQSLNRQNTVDGVSQGTPTGASSGPGLSDDSGKDSPAESTRKKPKKKLKFLTLTFRRSVSVQALNKQEVDQAYNSLSDRENIDQFFENKSNKRRTPLLGRFSKGPFRKNSASQ